MSTHLDDPRFTAYALGEELAPAERAEIERLLQASPHLRKELEEMRRTVQLLQKELEKEPCPRLSPESREAIELASAKKSKVVLFSWNYFYPSVTLAFAASLLLALFLPDWIYQSRELPSQSEPQDSGTKEYQVSIRPRNPPYPVPIVSSNDLTSLVFSSDTPLPPANFYAENRATLEDLNLKNSQSYSSNSENPFREVAKHPLSTFSIDVDTASYSSIRRFINQGMLPPPDAVRIEELINYFSYSYTPPQNEDPFAAQIEISDCPWNEEHRLVRIGLRGKEISLTKRPASNLVFLIDLSGSMQPDNKLPLVKRGLRVLAEQLTENDRVAMIVYAGKSSMVLPSTTGDQKEKILRALEELEAGGSTNGEAGIKLAYQTAVANFIKGGINRVILATDGDFNVGITDQTELVQLIEEKAKSGVCLSVLGFGMGNSKDSTLGKLADKGNGNYADINHLHEARKVFVEQMSGTLMTIAKDVKIQIEFNPAQVKTFRLIGYENRVLRHQDFNDDQKDAGEIGAGHTVTAFYEIVPTKKQFAARGADPLKYEKSRSDPLKKDESDELLTLKLRYKQPDGTTSKLMEIPVKDSGSTLETASKDFKFAAAVAEFGMLLRNSEHKGSAHWAQVLELAKSSKGEDRFGYRAEFIELVQKAKDLAPNVLSLEK